MRDNPGLLLLVYPQCHYMQPHDQDAKGDFAYRVEKAMQRQQREILKCWPWSCHLLREVFVCLFVIFILFFISEMLY